MRTRTVARLGAGIVCGLLVAGTLAACGGRKTVTKTVTVAGIVPNGGATSVSASVAAGAHDFVQFACAQCHGDRGRGGVSTDIPALDQVGKQLTVAQLTQIIDHGLGESANPTKPYMPVWGEVISAHQVGDLVAYVRAGLPSVPGATPAPVITARARRSKARSSISATAGDRFVGRLRVRYAAEPVRAVAVDASALRRRFLQ